MTKKQILRCSAFLLVVVCMLMMLCVLFEQTHGTTGDSVFHTYRELEKDTIDAVFMGTSGVTCYWLGSKAYEEFGMTVYSLASDAMPSWLYTNVMEEALAYQSPQLLILDIRPFTSPATQFDELDYRSRNLLDALKPFSANYIRSAFKTMKAIHAITGDTPQFDVSYLLSFVKYHSKWSDGSYSFTHQLDGSKHENRTGGFYLDHTVTVKKEPMTPHLYSDAVTSDLLPIHEAALHEVMDYIREKNLNVLFVDTPRVYTDMDAMGRVNTVFQILEKEGFDYVSFLTTAKDGSFSIDLDYNSDFFNSHHVNYYGAEKFTRAFSEYLNQNYALPDRRTNPGAKAYWDGIYDYIKMTVEDYALCDDNGADAEPADVPIGE